jgi:hypothetical protein
MNALIRKSVKDRKNVFTSLYLKHSAYLVLEIRIDARAVIPPCSHLFVSMLQLDNIIV